MQTYGSYSHNDVMYKEMKIYICHGVQYKMYQYARKAGMCVLSHDQMEMMRRSGLYRNHAIIKPPNMCTKGPQITTTHTLYKTNIIQYNHVKC